MHVSLKPLRPSHQVVSCCQGGVCCCCSVGCCLIPRRLPLCHDRYVNQQTTFYLSAAFGLVGAAVSWVFLPDTTGMSLDELDRMAKYQLAGEFEHYHGEGVNPKHLSNYEK